MTHLTTKLVLLTAVLALAGGCATIPTSTLGPTARYACSLAQGGQVSFAVCAARGRPYPFGHSHMTPNLSVSLATADTALRNLRDWRITVTRDGKVIHRADLPPAPKPSNEVGRHAWVETYVRLPGAKWVPGHYRVTLVSTLNAGDRVETKFVVPAGATSKAAAKRQS